MFVSRSFPACKAELTNSPIAVHLNGANRATAASITATAAASVLQLCRRLLAAGHDPSTPLDVYRGDVLALRVRSIGEAARLTVCGSPPMFVVDAAWNTPTAPPVHFQPDPGADQGARR
jgi:hypothetical protein